MTAYQNKKTLKTIVFLILGMGVFVAMVGSAYAQKFDLKCTLYFDNIKEDQEIDNTCPTQGNATKDKQIAQNAGKNNFCAERSPVTITYDTLVSLQSAAAAKNIPFGAQGRFPENRDDLKDLLKVGTKKVGEGSLVQLVTYVLDAHYSNEKKKSKGTSGETVNCNTAGKEFNDIHIELVNSPAETDACKSETAEISPHFRPSSWAEFDSSYAQLKGRPVRMTGALFFDSVHAPCKGGKRTSPARISLWEIHPVYAIDVCKFTALKKCSASIKSAWVPLDQWVGHADEEEP